MKEVQGRHSIFLNNLQAGKVSEFIINLIVCKRDRRKLVKKRVIYCTLDLRKSVRFISGIRGHEKLKAFFHRSEIIFAEMLTEES